MLPWSKKGKCFPLFEDTCAYARYMTHNLNGTGLRCAHWPALCIHVPTCIVHLFFLPKYNPNPLSVNTIKIKILFWLKYKSNPIGILWKMRWDTFQERQTSVLKKVWDTMHYSPVNLLTAKCWILIGSWLWYIRRCTTLLVIFLNFKP